MLGERGAGFYSDVQGSLALLKYKTTMAGCCGMIVHPTWGTKSYPATLFVKAPLHVIQNFFDKIVN